MMNCRLVPKIGQKRNTFMVLAMLFYSLQAFAFPNKFYIDDSPEKTIRGVVFGTDNEPLEGATVQLKGSSSIGTVTNQRGEYQIKTPDDAKVLIFSSVGYETQEVSIVGRNQANVTLNKIYVSQEEVVVTVGYGTQKKKDLTSSISTIKSSEMNLGGVTSNAAQAIQGRASGVQVSQTNAAPGGQTIVRIRGGNSVNSTNEPLYVVDGFPSETGIDIAPGDIEDIQILKDASATAIYGARGANGVVLITTKRGKMGKSSIQYDGYHGWQKIIRGYNKMSGKQDMETTNAKAIENGDPAYYTAEELASGIDNDWFKLATRVAGVKSHTLSISGGNQDTKVALSGNYFSQEGALRNTDYNRFSIRLNVDKKFGDRVKVGANIYLARTVSMFKNYDGNIVPSNVMFGILTASPAVPAYNADGSFARFRGRDNPLAWLLAPTNDRFGNKVSANAFMDVDIIKHLKLHINGGTELNATKEGTYISRALIEGEKVKGKASLTDLSSIRNLVEAYLTYNNKFADAHEVTLTAGVAYQNDEATRHYTAVQNFSTDAFLYNNLGAATERLLPESFKIPALLASQFARANYNFNDRILATFSLRRDFSSRFGPNKRAGYFPAGSIAWRVIEEKFIKDIKAISNLKLRVSYGVTGNDRIGDYIFLTTFVPTNVTLDGQNSYGGVVASRLPNANLKWESTSQFDIGADIGFLDNRISITLDYYKKRTNDLILDIPVGDWLGFSSQTKNVGAIENTGFEVSIVTNNYATKQFSWSTTLNLAKNKQKTIDLGGRPYIITKTANPYGGRGIDFTRLAPGTELSLFYGYQYAGVVKTGEVYKPQPESQPGDPKYIDINGDNIIDANDRVYLGNANPHYIYGINNDITFGDFQLNVFFQGAAGYSLFNVNKLMLESGPGIDALKRWTTKNEETDIPRNGYNTTYGGYLNSRFVEKADYLRCKMINLGYNLPLANTALKSIKRANIYVSAQNLFIITGYTGSDPEVNTRGGNANLAAGLDYTAFPAFKTVTLGLKLDF